MSFSTATVCIHLANLGLLLTGPGQTEWSQNGRYTGKTELELTQNGENQVSASGKIIVGSGRLIDPANLAHVYSSPRRRAVQTFEIAFSEADRQALNDAKKVSLTERLAEWDYGQYEGLVTKEIRALRQDHGLDAEKPWDIWRDGCEGGEYVVPTLFRALLTSVDPRNKSVIASTT